MVRVAVVGLGWWGRTLNQRLRTSVKIRPTYGVDLDLGRLAGIDGLDNLELTDDYDSVLARTDVDAVIIATPHALHEEQVLRAAAHGKHVFCEKPLNLSAAGARLMVESCLQRGLVLGVGHERRFEPALVALAQMIGNGTLGRVSHVDCNWSHDGVVALSATDWRKDPKHAPAGMMTGLGVHITDWFQHAIGPVIRLSAQATRGTRMGGTDEAIQVRFVFDNDVTGWLCCLGVTPFYFRLVAYGEKGWAEVRQFSNVDVAKSAFIDLRLAGRDVERLEYPIGDAILANLEAWADEIAGTGKYPNTPDQMIHNIEILEAILLSSAESRSVDIAELAPGQTGSLLPA